MHFELFLNDLIASKLEAVEMAFIAKIVTFDRVKMRATIRPMLFAQFSTGENKRPEPVNVPDIQNVPVELIYAGGAYIRPDYKEGDMVHVSCYASPIQQPIDANTRVNAKKLRFQLSSCTVTAGLVPKAVTVPAEWSNEPGLLIGKNGIYISFDSASVKVKGNLSVNGDITVTGDVNASGDVSAQGDVKAGLISLKNHTHTSGAPGSPTSPPLP
jgi:hypothetical protein